MEKKKEFLKLKSNDGGLAFALLMCLYVFAVFIGQSIAGAIAPAGSVTFYAICAIFPALVISVIIVYYCVYKKFNPLEVTGIKKFNPCWLLFSLVLFVGAFFGLGFINGLFQTFLESFGLKFDNDIVIYGVGELVVYIIFIAIVPAVFEEMFFRGLLLNAFNGSKKVVAILLSSMCFALYHASAVQLFYQFLMGVGLALLALNAKSIIPCIVTHFLNNFVILLLTYFNVKINLYNALLIVGGVALLVVFVLFTVRNLVKNKTQSVEERPVVSFFLPFGVLGVAVCLLLVAISLIPVA